MAIYHLSVKVVSRSSGRSSVGAAAYRAGDLLKNERDGITHDYTKKTGVVHSEIILPENAPTKYQDRGTLWNAVEKSEKRKDAQTAREIEIALPIELSRKEQVELCREFINNTFISRGMCADFSIHDKKDGNPHAHIMLTTREVSAAGFGKKAREWNDKRLLENWREQWAVTCNRTLQKKNIPERIDHRSYKDQGIVKEPTIHMGTAATQLKKRGKKTDRGKINEEVRARNMQYEKDFAVLESMIKELKAPPREQPAPAEIGAGIGGRAVSHPERSDEQATRAIQRGGGLGREEYAQAKGEEMEAAPSIRRSIAEGLNDLMPAAPEQPAPTKPNGGTSGDQGAEVRDMVKDLNELELQFINHEITFARQRAEAAQNRQQEQQKQNEADKIRREADNLRRLQSDIQSRTAERGSLGIFKGKEKRRLDAEIESLKQSYEQAATAFKREHGIEPSQAGQAIETLKREAAALHPTRTMEQQKKEIASQKEHAAILLEYKTKRALADIHPESKAINDLIAKTRPQAKPDAPMAARQIVAGARSKLDSRPTPEEYKTIVQRIAEKDPEKALKVLEVAKAHYSKGRDHSPKQSRGHGRGGMGGMER